MPQYVLTLDAHGMDHVPDEDMPDVDRAAHAVSQEAIDAGVWVCGSGLEHQRASIVAADGTVRDGPQVTVGGLTVIEVPSRDEAHKWAAKWATACRCDQEVWELGFDPEIDAMLRAAARLSIGGPLHPGGMAEHERTQSQGDHEDEEATGRDRSTETEPTVSGHSTAQRQTRRNAEDESPS